MKFIQVVEAKHNNPVYINCDKIVSVFKIPEGDWLGITCIGIVDGNWLYVLESPDVVMDLIATIEAT